MGKNFSTREAVSITKKFADFADNLSALARADALAKRGVVAAGDNIVRTGVMEVLCGVPVDELNRNKSGIRVKTLHDSGIHTIADIVTVSREELVNINGISEEAAYTIKRSADQFVRETAKQVKIRLSADDKNTDASNLVRELSIYRAIVPLSKEGRKYFEILQGPIEQAIEELRAACNPLKWLFAGRDKKSKAEEAYEYLMQMSHSEIVNRSVFIVKQSSLIQNINLLDAWQDFEENSISFFTTLEELCPGLLGSEDVLQGLPEDLARAVSDECFFPDGLNCSLRNYQLWGVKYILHQERVLLGDEMGLGKTVQAIAAMVSLKNTGATHFMVVCPASVITNWCREIVKHSKLRAIRIHGAERTNAFRLWQMTGGVAVTTYETTGHLKLDDDFDFSMLVVDEAHYIKNPDAKRTKNVAYLSRHAKRLLFMTGTALENRVDEMINLIQMLQPDVAREVSRIAYMSSAPQFRQKVAPVYYRRKREDVLKELPDLIEIKDWCDLGPEEEALYEQNVLSKSYSSVRRVSWELSDLSKSSKANRLKEIVEEAAEENRKVLVFSFFLDTISKIRDYLGDICMEPINGAVSVPRRQEIIDEFDKAPAGSVLLAQIQSGGTGLNIQSASVVVICEPQFKPSIENQAISRAYRMGQARNVIVHRLLCDDTVDEKIMDILEEKQKIFDAFADKSVAAQETSDKSLAEAEMDETTFGKIIEEEIARIMEKRG